jgi:anti-anti-sigma factor
MAINEWSEHVLVVDLQNEPLLSDDLMSLAEGLESREHPCDVVLNFLAVGFLNSSNISQMLRVREALRTCGGRLCLCSVNSSIASVLEVTHLDRLFHQETDTASALAALQIAADHGE